MKVTLPRVELNRVMPMLARLAVARHDVLSNVRIEVAMPIQEGQGFSAQATLTASDGHIFASLVLSGIADAPGVVLVPAQMLLSLVRGSKGEQVTLSASGDKKVAYKCGSVTATLARYYDEHHFVRPSLLGEARGGCVPSDLLGTTILSLVPFADDAAETLNRANIAVWLSNRHLKALTTDSFRFARVRLDDNAIEANAEAQFFVKATDAQLIVPFIADRGETLAINIATNGVQIQSADGAGVQIYLPLAYSEAPPLDYFEGQAGQFLGQHERDDPVVYEIRPADMLASTRIMKAVDPGNKVLRATLKAMPDEIELSATGPLGTARHICPADPVEYSDSISIVTQVRYLDDLLRACPDETLELHFPPETPIREHARRVHNSVYAVTKDGSWDQFLMRVV